jgi:hypothetical protein
MTNVVLDGDALADKIRRGEEISAEETRAVFKTADAAGILYYKMLTMVREQRSLAELPATLKEIIKSGAWRHWRWVGSTFSQNSLGAYLKEHPPNGVGIEPETVEKMIADDAEALKEYRDALVGEQGAHNDNIIMKAEQGTSLAYTLDRLNRDHPELFAKVAAKELSAHAAAIAAGFRKKLTPFETIRKLIPKLTDDERSQLRSML